MNRFHATRFFICIFSIGIIFLSCEEEPTDPTEDCVNSDFFNEYSARNFEMGFSTWPYAPTSESVDATYEFIKNNADIYSEHIDANIPWNAWIKDLPLPAEFTNEIAGRKSRRIANTNLTLSISLLNNARDELAADFDGTIPDYVAMNDKKIEDAYVKHLQYITNELNPDYLIIAIEVNELLINSPGKWQGYKSLIAQVKARIKQQFPTLSISESVTLHNLFQPDVPNPQAYVEEIVTYVNDMEFAAISFYPFFNGLNSEDDFQDAFNFLHDQINKPIAFAETSHLSEDLSVASFDLFITGDNCEQNEYLESLLTNAQEQNYHYIIWWAHRDYDELWETFPEEVQDLGKLWISTGIINEDGAEKEAFSTWQMALSK